MNKTKIEWCDYTINPIKGLCQGECWYCYARRMYKRFKWPQKVTYRPEELEKIAQIKEPSRIFICSTHDLFGDWIPDEWIKFIVDKCRQYPQHTFFFLTKNPRRYRELMGFGDFKFPDNCYLGMTADGSYDCYGGSFWHLKANTFVSVEPLLKRVTFSEPINTKWIIIGAFTGLEAQKYTPKQEWIDNILMQAYKFRIPIFMKNNLRPYYKGKLIQEFPVRRPGLMRAKL